MKSIILSLALLFSATAFSQNLLVNFWPVNQPYPGLTNWPQGVKPVSFSTNAPGWATNMTISQFNSYKAVQQPVYDAGASNVVWSAQQTVLQDIADLQARLDANNDDRLNMMTNTLTLNQLNNVTLRILKTLKKVNKLLIDQYGKNSQDSDSGN
jgi:hypothetical protein